MVVMSSRTEKLVQSLENLRNLNYSTSELARPSHAKVESLLNLIFDIGTKKISFTEDERKTVGRLLLNAIRPIKINIERVGCQYRTSLESSVLRKRSALEFLIKDYGDLSAGEGTTLSEKLAASNIQESISILDEIISKWRDVSDSDEAESNQEIEGIPASHTWWSS